MALLQKRYSIRWISFEQHLLTACAVLGSASQSTRRSYKYPKCCLWNIIPGSGTHTSKLNGLSDTNSLVGTPHHGSSLATCGKMIANIVAACSPLNPAKNLLGVLQKESEVLFEIMEDFLEKAKELQLVSFFEMEATNFGIFRRLV